MKFRDYDKAAEKYDMGGGWMNLEEGDNKVRIVSEFEDFGTHWDNKKKKGFTCIGKDDCEWCQRGDKPKVQFIGWVIDRKDNKVKLLRIGYKIFQQLGTFAKSDEYSFEGIPPYDVNIQRVGTGLNTVYTVLPARKNTELTKEEEAQVEEAVKSPKEIIENMKAKVSTLPLKAKEEEINEEDIPF